MMIDAPRYKSKKKDKKKDTVRELNAETIDEILRELSSPEHYTK